MSVLSSQEAFLLCKIPDLKSEISTRLSNILQNEGFETIFSALRQTEKDLSLTPMLGRRGITEFRELVGAMGFKPGDTQDFFEANKDFFTYVARHPHYPRDVIWDKKIVDFPGDPARTILDADYKNKVQEFVAHRGYQPPSPTEHGRDLDWIVSLLPDSLKDGMTPEFSKSAFGTLDFKAGFGVLREEAQKLAIKAVQQHLNRT